MTNFLIKVITKDQNFEAELTGDSEFWTPNSVCPDSEYISDDEEPKITPFYATSVYKFMKHNKECSFQFIKSIE